MNLRWKDCLKIGVSIFILYLCIHYFPAALSGAGLLLGASMPLILGACIAYVVGILMSAFERGWTMGSPGLRRVSCLVLAYLSLATAVVVIVALILPQLADCVSILLAEIPGAMTKAVAFIESLNIVPQDLIAPLLKVDWHESFMVKDLKTVCLDDIYVRPAYRRRGIAAKLFAQVEGWARERGAVRLELHTWDFNQGAIAMYRDMGMTPQRYVFEKKL